MGVPAHDERDYNFAKKYKLPIKFIIECKDHDRAYIGDGKHINSKLINGLNILEAQKKITQLTSKYRELSNASGLPFKTARLRVSDYKRISMKG